MDSERFIRRKFLARFVTRQPARFSATVRERSAVAAARLLRLLSAATALQRTISDSSCCVSGNSTQTCRIACPAAWSGAMKVKLEA
jgi:hypothetical protein